MDKIEIIIPEPKIISPNRITENLPKISLIAPENNCTKANGNINAGIEIKISVGETLKSEESAPNNTKRTFPVSGPSQNNKYITLSIMIGFFTVGGISVSI